jgi:hypothetical protein
VFGTAGLDLCWAQNYQVEVLCWYVPEFSPLVRPLLDSPALPPRAWVIVAHAVSSAVVLGLPLLLRSGDALAAVDATGGSNESAVRSVIP